MPRRSRMESGRDCDTELRHVHERSIVVPFHRRLGPHGNHTVDAYCAECDVLHDERASYECRFHFFGQLVQRRDIGSGIHRRGQPAQRLGLRALVHVRARGRERRGGRTALVHGVGHIRAGFAFDSDGYLRNDRGGVRRSDGSCPDQHQGGNRNHRLPELFDRDVQFHLHRRKLRRRVRNHCPHTNRPRTTRLRILKSDAASRRPRPGRLKCSVATQRSRLSCLS